MIITRKIEIFVCESDKKQKEEYVHTLYQWRDLVRKAANMIVSHKFVHQNVRDFAYLQEDIMERFLLEHPDRLKVNQKTGVETVRFNVQDVIREGKGMSEQNTTYRLISGLLSGKVPSDIYSCLNQAVCKTFKETVVELLKGEASLRSYKNNIPMPFSASSLSNIHGVDEEYADPKTGEMKPCRRYYFTLFGIPFCCLLGRDRSNNASVIDRCLSGEYKLCSSAIGFKKVADRMTGKKHQKLYLYLHVDIPATESRTDPKKELCAYLGISNPIVCSTDVKARNAYDSGIKFFGIGTREEFLDRRIEIQQAIRRCQIACRYAKAGLGRRRKLQAIQRFRDVERNYVDTKTHVYSHRLVQYALSHRCGVIRLLDQKRREKEAKDDAANGEQLLLRNWSYFNLKTKIVNKAAKYGIRVIVEGDRSKDEDDTKE